MTALLTGFVQCFEGLSSRSVPNAHTAILNDSTHSDYWAVDWLLTPAPTYQAGRD